MSQENVEIVKRAYELFNSEAFIRAATPDLRLFDLGVVWDTSNAALDGAVFRGHDGLREWVSLQQSMWERQRLEPQEFFTSGDGRVVVVARMTSVGRDEVETVAHAATVFTVHDGKIAHVKAFQSKAEALEAVGLSE